MNIQVSTDQNLKGNTELNNYVERNLSEVFERYDAAITRVEVHLSDENTSKKNGDKRCLLEARISNRQPIVVSHHARSTHQVIDLASSKLLRAIDKMAGKATNHKSPRDILAEPNDV